MWTNLSCAILISFLAASVVQAAQCDSFKSIKETKELCWLESHKAWISKKCVAKDAKCDALTFLKNKKLTFEKDIYRDKSNNEFIFAIFKDKSMIDMDTVNELVQ